MEDFLEFLGIAAFVGLCVAVFVGMLVISIQIVNIQFIDNVPIVVSVDDKEVYKGVSAGCEVDSSGANTTVQIKGRFLYMLPVKYYVSKNVKVINQNEVNK